MSTEPVLFKVQLFSAFLLFAGNYTEALNDSKIAIDLLPYFFKACVPGKSTINPSPLNISFLIATDHFTVVDGSEAVGDLVLIQTFLLYYVNQVILMLTSTFQEQFP